MPKLEKSVQYRMPMDMFQTVQIKSDENMTSMAAVLRKLAIDGFMLQQLVAHGFDPKRWMDEHVVSDRNRSW